MENGYSFQDIYMGITVSACASKRTVSSTSTISHLPPTPSPNSHTQHESTAPSPLPLDTREKMRKNNAIGIISSLSHLSSSQPMQGHQLKTKEREKQKKKKKNNAPPMMMQPNRYQEPSQPR